ncbi:MAG: DUF4384 domain-containing protein [Nitrospirales bacterium]
MNGTTLHHFKNLLQAALGRLRKQHLPVFLLVGVCLLIPGYGQAGFLDKALDFGKDLLGKAALNYSNKYEQKLNQLLQSLRQPGIVNQPLIQGITPGSPYDPNAPYGTTDPTYGTPYGGDPYGQQSGYGQGTQQWGYYGQTSGAGYPNDPYSGGYPSNDPNYGGYPSNDPYNNPNSGYPQGEAYGQNQAGYPNDPYNPNPDYSQGGAYGQTQGGYPTGPTYGGYPQTGQQGGNYGQYPNQGYPADPNYGNDPYADSNQYGQTQGGQDPYDQYGGGGYSAQPAVPAQQGGYDPYQPQATNPPQEPTYAQPSIPQYPTDPGVQIPEQPTGQVLEALQLDVALVKKTLVNGAETLLPIHDGDILMDGRGNAKAGDKFRIMFRAKTDCYVYVIAIDGSAWAQGVFPSLTSPFENPVKQGKQYVIPEGNNWFSLDQFKGLETVFFVASPEKRQDIEEILASIAGRERHPKAKAQPVTEAPIIPAGFHHSQQSSTPFTIDRSGESDQGILPTTFFTQKAGEALRVTRWFRHQ